MAGLVVITGASDGLGLAIAKLYSETGAVVVNISRRECEYATHNFLCDVRNPDEIRAAVQKIEALAEPIEYIINCAGVLSVQPLAQVHSDEVVRVMETNINAAIILVADLAERIEKDGTDIVNVASTVGTKAYPGQAAYGASKWAMRGFSQNLQVEFKGKPNRAISFCVGGMRTDIGEKIGIPMTDPENWMIPGDAAKFMKQILDLPKNMEVSEVVINRK